jgi:hypothetical protein
LDITTLVDDVAQVSISVAWKLAVLLLRLLLLLGIEARRSPSTLVLMNRDKFFILKASHLF